MTGLPAPVRLFEVHARVLLPLAASSTPCQSCSQEWPFCISEGWVHLWARWAWTGKRGRAASYLSDGLSHLGSRGECGFPTLWRSMACREGWRVAADPPGLPPCIPPRGARSYRSSVYLLGFHVRAPGKQGFSDEAQEAAVSVPRWRWPQCSANRSQVGRGADPQVSHFRDIFPRFLWGLVHHVVMSRSLLVSATMQKSWLGQFCSFDLVYYVLLFPLRQNLPPVFLFSPCFLILISDIYKCILRSIGIQQDINISRKFESTMCNSVCVEKIQFVLNVSFCIFSLTMILAMIMMFYS